MHLEAEKLFQVVDIVGSKETIQVEMGGSSLLDGCIVHGPWGGSFGGEWVYMPDIGFTKSLKISVRYGEVIDSINFQTCFTTGETLSSSFGGKGGNRTDTVTHIV
ncbi:putative jacalin-like lectin domain-containing protein [Helianthus annuus]|nr:putative jacalin-like lectin domain-containing protein [Helianthus annuus]KAJ0785936.1 putative jacalin-like lectin domain-containing protein [Helianthus annuus]